jgi:P27 family predicted phage terminase small subunit
VNRKPRPAKHPGDTAPAAPKHLQPETRRWFESVITDFVLEAHHVRLLTLACEAWDRAGEARELLAREGLTFTDRLGSIRAHPAAALELGSRIAFARLVRELALDVEGQTEERSRPPVLRGNAARRAR